MRLDFDSRGCETGSGMELRRKGRQTKRGGPMVVMRLRRNSGTGHVEERKVAVKRRDGAGIWTRRLNLCMCVFCPKDASRTTKVLKKTMPLNHRPQ